MKAVGFVLLVLIRAYQLLISPMFPPSCRYFPTCSDYARQAVTRHGPLAGSWLALKRLARCHPWGGLGYDPVPDRSLAANPRSGTSASLGLGPDCHHLDHLSGR
ncbi:MAG: membrane protein insertion efficiency factor YidD [Kiloniellaceae bacterium]